MRLLSFTARLGFVVLALGVLAPAHANDSWFDNTRTSLDLSVRGMYEANSENFGSVQFAGLDLHKVFTGSDGDIGTLLVQVYATSLYDVEGHPPIFSDKDDTAVVYRSVYFNFKGLDHGRLNVKVGHFEVPFGIEQLEDTNGKLKDYMHGPNLGVKADWGVSINGATGSFEYEIALMRGSGNDWETAGDPYILAARIGTPRDANLMFGLSAMTGKVSTPGKPSPTIERSRVAVDAHWYWRRLEFIGEVSVGKDADDDVVNGIFEVDYHAMDASWLAFTQIRRFSYDRVGGKDDATSIVLGVELDPDNHWSLQASFEHDLDTFETSNTRNLWKTQARYRF